MNSKLNYDDFYKFITSLCILIMYSTFIVVAIFFNQYKMILLTLLLILFFTSIFFLIWALKKWYANQNEVDIQRRLDTKIKAQKLKDMESQFKEDSKIKSKKEVSIGKYKKESLNSMSYIRITKGSNLVSNDINPVRFENEVMRVLSENFEAVKYLGEGRGYRADVVIKYKNNQIPVEVKLYTNDLPMGAIYQLRAFMDYSKGFDTGIIITRGGVSDKVDKEAYIQNIHIIPYADILIDQNKLADHIKRLIDKEYSMDF